MGDFGTCRYCGARILWIPTIKRKMMPVDPEIVEYRKPEDGEKFDELLVTERGEVVKAVREHGTGSFGYVSHFATCPYAKH